ncbi:MAG TPA: HupE/UreJ family protein [Kofleriaceae bacterium]
MIRVVAIAFALAFATRSASAHDLRPGVLAIVESPGGALEMRFQPPVDSRGEATDVRVELPPGCTRDGTRLRCEHGFTGELAVLGMRGASMKTLVTVAWGDGSHQEWILDAGDPRVTIGGPPPSTAHLWIRIGVEHILGGPDHLAFVIGLLLVLQLAIDRRLLLTITAFTIAHSLTLALAVLGVVRVPIAPVEACIALSVLLVAREATHQEPTAIRRWPWLAAGAFGLIHGLGFAAALGEIGLPRAALAWSLVWFNVGVELGQLAVVAVVVAIAWLWRRLVGERWVIGPRVHRTVSYLLGALAAWWFLDRVVELASGAR